MSTQQSSTNFVLLPTEILQLILSFGMEISSNFPTRLTFENSSLKFVLNFQALNKKISTDQEMMKFFDEFWWKVWKKSIGYNPLLEEKYKLMIDKIGSGELKRIVLIAKYVKYNIEKHLRNQLEEAKIVVTSVLQQVGKSSITFQFCRGIFVEEYDPTIDECNRKQVLIDELPVLIDILDWTGQDEFTAIRDAYYRTGEGFIFVCDLTNIESVDQSQLSLNQIIKSKDSFDFPIIFALNKLDLLKDSDRNETVEKFTKLLDSLIEKNELKNTAIFACSAKTGENIHEIFYECVRRKRYNSYESLRLLENIVKYDSEFIQISKKKMKKQNNQSKNCFII